jgi:hypothetical protein
MKSIEDYKKENINIEEARESILRYFKEYCKMDKLESWDNNYYYKVFEIRYYNDICRSDEPVKFHNNNYKNYKVIKFIEES